MEQRTQFYIDGQWVSPAGTGKIEVFSPTDGALLATPRYWRHAAPSTPGA